MKGEVNLPAYEKRKLGKRAQELGFARDTLEKACRLAEILKFLNTNPLLKDSLALKGGTAINLTIFNLPRLSIDIDLDYLCNNSLDEMRADRGRIFDSIIKYMSANRYELSSRSKTTHALDSSVFSYVNAAGMKDNIKIEINYSLRAHVLATEHRELQPLGLFDSLSVHSLAPLEIFGSKIVALLTRAAARDLYDINNMIYFGLFDESQWPLLKKCAVFYSALGSQEAAACFPLDNVDTLTKHKIKTDLLPVIRRTEHFDLQSVQRQVKEFLSSTLCLDDCEIAFLRAFAKKEYRPELLFDDKDILSRVENHPMVLWKMRNSLGGPSR
ncbi:MAG: nucleotidyl transferase AbiEii/AbiGii toxin family protein [Selenomonadales bacterium]|nr:nucleotidyl transferase AbiEii/AbiGii toxin family protein [Selenomonadales bacterium]